MIHWKRNRKPEYIMEKPETRVSAFAPRLRSGLRRTSRNQNSHNLVSGYWLLVSGYWLLLTLWLLVPAAHALTVYPVKIEISLEAQAEYTDTITVQNNTLTLEHIQVSLSDFILGGRDNKIPPSCAGWVRFSPQEFDLNPREKKTVRYSILPARDKAGKFKSIFYFTENAGHEKAGRMKISARVGIPVTVKVAPLQNQRFE